MDPCDGAIGSTAHVPQSQATTDVGGGEESVTTAVAAKTPGPVAPDSRELKGVFSESPTAAPTTIVEFGQPTTLQAALEAKLEYIRALCRSARVFEAVTALRELEIEAEAAQRRVDVADHPTGFINLLRNDLLLARLQEVHDLMSDAIGLTVAPSTKGTAKWTIIQLREPALGEDFVTECRVRFAEGEEYEPDGPSTQLIGFVRVSNFPLRMSQLIALDYETDACPHGFLAGAQLCRLRAGPRCAPQQWARRAGAGEPSYGLDD